MSEIFEIDEALLSSLEEDEDNSDFEDEGVSEPEDFDEDSDDYDEWDDSDSEDELNDAEEEDSDGEIESDYAESTDSSEESDSEDLEDDDEWSDDLQDEEDDDSLIQTSQELDNEDDEDDNDWDDQDASESDDEDEWADDEHQDDEIESDEDDDFDEDWSDISETQGIQPHVDEISVESSQHMVDASVKEVKRVTKKPDKQRKETSDSSFDDFLASVPRQVVQPVRQEPSVEAPPVVNRSAEPNDIRAFVRAHPHCTDDDLERYFTKKAISKARILGKIIKKGKTYQI